jgi:hypothetical protein
VPFFLQTPEEKVMLVLHGYIDDSGDSQGHLFTLSCLHGDIAHWTFLEMEWVAMLEAVNKGLRAKGRKELSRYHAAERASRKGDFAGWSLPEQIELTKAILRILENHALHVISYSIDLRTLVQEIPETRPNPRGFAYVLLLKYLMLEIGDFTLSKYKDAIIGLTHDHCDYDAALLESFNEMIEDRGFAYRAQRRGSLTFHYAAIS